MGLVKGEEELMEGKAKRWLTGRERDGVNERKGKS